jgi:hypothetical protein
MRTAKEPTSRILPRRGLALVLVVCVMALASILAYALLSGASLQATASDNSLAAAVAEGQAESGIHLAMYYLMNPSHAPTLTNGYWPGASGITFSTTATPAAQMPGNVTVTVTNPSTDLYDIASIGSSQGASMGGGVMTRTITAQVQVATSYQIPQAATFNSTMTLSGNVSITGSPTAIASAQKVTLSTGSTVTGNVEASLLSQSGGIINGNYLGPDTNSTPAPSAANLNYYLTYTYQGQTYSATQLGSATLTSGNMPAANPATNPLNVYYYTGGDLTLTGPINLAGTLVVQGGNLILQGNGNTITAQSGMPALITDKAIKVKGTNNSLTINGVAYAASGIANVGGANTGSTLTINGAILVSSGTTLTSNGTAVSITYNSALASAPTITTANQTPTSVKLVSWSE